ncbi:MAG: ABC transporter substrate-binding protein [Oscillospiraceae bacterium]|jgi:polar amino acid transport system substrate-binding protein|nr:ABC transporter substrate-binding protein [Oscillospiraceae bacterium]
MKKILSATLALLLLLSLTLAVGCNKTVDGDADPTDPAVSGEPTPDVPAGSRNYRTAEEIQASGELVVLTNATFEPYEYVAGGEVVGADMELAQLIADELGVTLKIIDMDFDLIIDALKSGKGDLVAAGMTATPERAEQVDFSTSYVDNGLLIIVAADSSISTAAGLAGQRVSLQEGTTADEYVTDMDPAAREILRFKDAIAAGNAVSSGKADACVLDIKPAEGVVANSGGALVLLREQLTEEPMAMAVAKGNATLLTVVDTVLGAAIDDGTVEQLVEKHMELTAAAE